VGHVTKFQVRKGERQRGRERERERELDEKAHW